MQWLAMNESLPMLIPCGTTKNPKWEPVVVYCEKIIHAFVSRMRDFGDFTTADQTSYAATFEHDYGEEFGSISIYINLISGISYVTELQFQNFGLNLTYLTNLARALPRLRLLSFENCNNYGANMGIVVDDGIARQLPATLALATPNITYMWFKSCNLTGSLPKAYGAWKNLKWLYFDNNNLSGQVPQVHFMV
jgi:hypothetical protein